MLYERHFGLDGRHKYSHGNIVISLDDSTVEKWDEKPMRKLSAHFYEYDDSLC